MPKSRAPHALLLVLAGLAALLTATTVGAQSRYERPGVTLFEDTDFRGRQETFFADVTNLERSSFGANVASSVRVAPGCRVTLYSEISFRGRSIVLTENEPSLTRTRLGNDALASMRVYCPGQGDDGRYDDDHGSDGGYDDRDDVRHGSGRGGGRGVGGGQGSGDHDGRSGGGYDGPRDDDDDHHDYGDDDYDPSWRRGKGVVLFEREDFRGRRAFFGDDEADLGRSRFNDKTSSLRVAPGCEVTLYSDRGFRGRSVVLNRDVPSLGQTRIGNDRVTSLRVSCGAQPPWGGWGGRGGAVLYEHEDFRGRQEVIEDDDPNLRDNPLGSDRVSSVRVAPGCRVTLYRDANYRGTAAVLTYDTPTLSGTRIGNDSVSSVQIACQGDDPDWDGRRGAVIFDNSDFRGRNDVVAGDIPRLRSTRVGNDRVSSVRVAPGCQVTLFADENFRGGSTVLTADAPSLSGSRVGNDSASSLRLECGGGGDDWGGRGGVRLYRDADFRGRSETFYDDDADLRNNSIGSDRVSSVRVAPGCRAILYEGSGFRGRSTIITEDTPSLDRDRIGNDSVSSLRVECLRRR